MHLNAPTYHLQSFLIDVYNMSTMDTTSNNGLWEDFICGRLLLAQVHKVVKKYVLSTYGLSHELWTKLNSKCALL